MIECCATTTNSPTELSLMNCVVFCSAEAMAPGDKLREEDLKRRRRKEMVGNEIYDQRKIMGLFRL